MSFSAMNRSYILLLILALFANFSQPLRAQRSLITLTEGWNFKHGDIVKAETIAFDDSRWEPITIPHTWNDPKEPQMVTKGARYLRGPGWYRRILDFPEVSPDQRTFLRFEAAAVVADIYLNGTKLGQHRGGFTAFTYEISEAIKPGNNLLSVRVDNSRFNDVPPLSGDFTVFGGLYRPVHLIQTGSLCISPLIHGSSGVSLRQSNVSAHEATVTVTTHLSNQGSKLKTFTLRTTVSDANGKTVTQQETEHNADSSSVNQSLKVSEPHLWHGTEDPYLYAVHVELIADGKVVDRKSEPLGLRFFNFDKDKGFSLNGQPLRLRGVCRHQDRAEKGWAISNEDMEEDMALIREMGANAVRLAHYPHSDYFLQLCDRSGLLVWSEIPLVNEIREPEPYLKNSIQQLEEMIAQLGNHPSIVTWGLWNELQGGAPALPVIQNLHNRAHQLDPTRPTTGASFKGSRKWCPEAHKVTDLLALNAYPGWYSGHPDDMGDILDDFRRFAPNQPISVSEYGSGASLFHHQQNMEQGPNPRGWWHPEEWQALSHEKHWKHIESRPYVWGSFIWNMFDFSSAGRREGQVIGMNDKGLVTHDRKRRKDTFFFYKAAWSKHPVLHITSRRHTLRMEPDTSLKIYGNGKNLKLTLNGEALRADKQDGVIYIWDKITLEMGSNILVATSEHNGKTISDWVNWTYAPDGKPERKSTKR